MLDIYIYMHFATSNGRRIDCARALELNSTATLRRDAAAVHDRSAHARPVQIQTATTRL